MKKTHLTSLLREIVIQRDYKETSGRQSRFIFEIVRNQYPYATEPDLDTLHYIEEHGISDIDELIYHACEGIDLDMFDYNFEALKSSVFIEEYPEHYTFVVRYHSDPGNPRDTSEIAIEHIFTHDFPGAYDLYEAYTNKSPELAAIYTRFCKDVEIYLTPGTGNIIPIEEYYTGDQDDETAPGFVGNFVDDDEDEDKD